MINILITGAGGPAAVALLKALQGRNKTLYAVDMSPHAAGLYRVPASQRALVPPGASPRFVPELQKLCLQWNIDVLIPTVDAELIPIANHRSFFTAQGTQVMLSSLASLEACLDKWNLAQHCADVVPLPTTKLLSASFDPQQMQWPCIVKPRIGSGSRGVFVCQSPEDLSRFPHDGSLIVQEFLPGEEYSVDVLISCAGHPVAAVPRARLKIDSGVAVTSKTVQDPELQQTALKAAQHLGLTGVVNVQLRRDENGRPKLLEINPRFPGTMSLTVASGVDMPNIALLDLLQLLVPPHKTLLHFQTLAMVRHWEEIYVDVSELETKSMAQISPADPGFLH